ncbi:MAG: hypothetical protein CL889_02460 [Dehalococcoidia bacterium]|nr:hypothetical protein [Dehalococcoidia bacterium]|tara:strand:- start:679 stop:1962 length:1284 start_codon:yes stop_codon:yes gene_type:complete
MSNPASSLSSKSWYQSTPVYYGWVVVAASFFANLIATGVQLWALTVMTVPMLEDLVDWQRGDIFGTFALRSIITAILTPFVGRYLDRRYGAQILLVIGAVIGGGSTIATSTVQDPWQFMLWFGLLGGISGPGAAYIVSSAIVPKWFITKRGKALAFSTMGTGMAALVMPLAVAFALTIFGWRDTWVLLGIAIIAITIPMAFLIRRQPEDVGLLPDGVSVNASITVNSVDFPPNITAPKALRSYKTWLMALATMLASMPLLGVPTNMVPMLQDRGMTLEEATLALTTYGLFSVLARFGWGTLADKRDVRLALMLLGAYGMVTTFMFVIAGTAFYFLFILAACTGFAVGGAVVLNPMLFPTYLGRRHIGEIMGYVSPLVAVGASMGPLLMAKVFDWTGSYEIGLLILSASWCMSATAIYAVGPPPKINK